jgi:hypothetical protein
MMKYHLIHPRHGKKIAYQDKEAEADKKNGWKEVTEEEFYGKKPDAKSETGQNPELVAKYEAKHGKKPHHRMSDETISAALE